MNKLSAQDSKIMRTLETLVSAVEGLQQALTWRLPLALGAVITLAVGVSFLLVQLL